MHDLSMVPRSSSAHLTDSPISSSDHLTDSPHPSVQLPRACLDTLFQCYDNDTKSYGTSTITLAVVMSGVLAFSAGSISMLLWRRHVARKYARDVPEMHPRSQPRYHARYTKIYIRAQRRLNLPDQLTSPVAAVAGRRCSRRVVSSARAARCRVSEAVASHANTRVVSHAALSLRARTGHRGGGGRAGRGGGAAAGRRCMRRAASPVTRGLVSSDGSACVRARAGMSSSLHIG